MSLVVHGGPRANLTLLLLFSQRHIDVGTQTAPEPSGARLATGAKPAARGRCVPGADGTLRRAVRAGDLCLEAERVPDQLRFRLRVRRPHVFQRVLRISRRGHPGSWTEPPDQLEDHGFRPEFADVPCGATVDPATVSPPGCWTELPVFTSYSDGAGAQEAKARDSIVERLGRVVPLEVSRG